MLIIAHRGASGYAPENTISAFRKAIDMGSKAIEIDVQLSKDGEVVVIHDYFLERVTNGKGKVKDYTVEELKQLDAGSWFDERFKEETIPTLQEVLKFVPEDVLLNIEIKYSTLEERNIEEKIIQLLRKYNRKNVLISSFNHFSLKKIRKLDKKIKIGVLLASNLINPCRYIEENKLKAYSLNVPFQFVNEKLVKKTHKEGYKIYSFTVNSKDTAEYFESIGVDAIFSDYPDILQKQD